MLGARKVCRVLLKQKDAFDLRRIGDLLENSTLKFLPLLGRYIDKAIAKNWVKEVVTPEPESRSTFQPTDCLKVIEACISGNLLELQELEFSGAVSQHLHDWVESIRDEHQGRKLCPLIAGIESGSRDTVKYLENQGAEVRAFPENKKSRNNLLHYLVYTPFTEEFDEIARKVISENQELLRRTNKKKKTPLEVAQAMDNKLMTSLFTEYLEDKTKPITPDSEHKPTGGSLTCQDESSMSGLSSCSNLEAECTESLDTLILSSLPTTEGCPIAEQEQYEDSLETSSENSFNYQNQSIQSETVPATFPDTPEDKKFTPNTNTLSQFAQSPALLLPISQTDRSEEILILKTTPQITLRQTEQATIMVSNCRNAGNITRALFKNGKPLTPEKIRDAMSQHCARTLKSIPLSQVKEGIKTALDKGWVKQVSGETACYQISRRQQVIEEAWEGSSKTIQEQKIPGKQLNFWIESRRPSDHGTKISPFMAAVDSQDPETIKTMLTLVTSEAKDSNGNNILHQLTQSGADYLLGIVKLLSIDNLHAIQLLFTENHDGELPVDIARRTNKEYLCRLYSNKMKHLKKDKQNECHIQSTMRTSQPVSHLKTGEVVVQKIDPHANLLDSSCLEVIIPISFSKYVTNSAIAFIL